MRRLNHTLTANQGHLAQITRKARRLDTATRTLRAVLPTSLRAHVAVLRIDRETLHVGAANSAVATRLRFEAPEIVDQLAKLSMFRHLQKLRVRVVDMGTGTAPSPPQPTPSPGASAALSALAEGLTARGDAARGLRQALEDLARAASAGKEDPGK